MSFLSDFSLQSSEFSGQHGLEDTPRGPRSNFEQRALLSEAARRVAARDRHKGLYLWVFERNEAAVGFYRALGGEIAERLISDWDKAPDEVRYRMHWPRAADLANR